MEKKAWMLDKLSASSGRAYMDDKVQRGHQATVGILLVKWMMMKRNRPSTHIRLNALSSMAIRTTMPTSVSIYWDMDWFIMSLQSIRIG